MRVFAPIGNIQKDQLDWGCGLCCDEEFHDGVKWADAKSTWAQKPSIEQGGRCPRQTNKQTGMEVTLRLECRTYRTLALALLSLLKASTEFTPLEEVGASCALCQRVSAYRLLSSFNSKMGTRQILKLDGL